MKAASNFMPPTTIDGQHFNPSLVLDLKDRTLRKDKLICTKLGNRITVKSKLINKQ